MKRIDQTASLFGIAGAFLALGMMYSKVIGSEGQPSDVALLIPMTCYLIAWGALMVVLARMLGHNMYFIFPPRGGRLTALKQKPRAMRGALLFYSSDSEDADLACMPPSLSPLRISLRS
jgi:hypothetical protein